MKIRGFVTALCLCALALTAFAENKELSVSLNNRGTTHAMEKIRCGYLYFDIVDTDGDKARVKVSFENTMTDNAVLVFQDALNAKALKKHAPKVEFVKTYPGDKNERHVKECRFLRQYFISVLPAESEPLLFVDVRDSLRLEIPLYIATYDPGKLDKRGKYNVNYKILAEEIVYVNLKVEAWSELDPDYQEAKKSIDSLRERIASAAFCKSKKHTPSLEGQKRPYAEAIDSLSASLGEYVKEQGWVSNAPQRAYARLVDELAALKKSLEEAEGSVCSRHGRIAAPRTNNSHSCAYCQMSEAGLYHKLEDIYTEMHTGRISRDRARSMAAQLNACYVKNSRRSKSAFYRGKISKYYNKIAR